MKVFIVFAHPEPKSFNGAMFRAACKTFQRIGSEIKSSDLYAMKFNPVSVNLSR
jgi:putative NADPH-quinone reductase